MIGFFEHASDPSTPDTGRLKLYAKSDGSLYTIDDAGLVQPLAYSAALADYLDKVTASAQNVAGEVTWAALQTFDAGIDITTAAAGGEAIKMPNGSWIMPQTSGQALYLTTGINPSAAADNAVLQVAPTALMAQIGDSVAGGAVAALSLTKSGNDGAAALIGLDSALSTYGAVSVSKEEARIEYTKAGIVAAYLDLDTDGTYDNGQIQLTNRSTGGQDLNTILMDTDTGVKISNDQVANTDCFLQLQGTAAILETSNSSFYEAKNQLNLGTVESALGTYDTTSPTGSFAEFRAFKSGYIGWIEARNGSNYAYLTADGSNGKVILESNQGAKITFLATGSTTRYVTTDSLGNLSYSSGIVGSAVWGSITGTLSAQSDLQTALNDKLSLTATGTQSIASNLDVASGWIQVSDTTGTPVSFLGISSSGKLVDGTALLSALDLQSAYNNGPTILTDATNVAVTIQRGSAADSDLVFRTKDGAGNTQFSVTGAGDTRVHSNTASSTFTNGAFIVDGGAGIGGKLNVGDAVRFYNVNDSTSSTTGSFIVDGGVGIAKSLWANKAMLGAVTDDTTSTLQVGGSVRTDSTITAAGYIQTSSYVLSINQSAGVDTGLTNMYGTSYATGNRYTTLKTNSSGSTLVAGVLGASGGVTNSLTVQAASNSNEENVFTFAVAGNTSIKKLAISDTTASTTSTTGALTVAGGAGIVGDLYGGGDGIFAGSVYANGGVVGSTSELQVNGSARISSTLLADNAVKTINTDANLLQGLVSYYGTVPETTGDRYLSVKATSTGSQITAGVLGTSGGVTNSLVIQAASNSNEETVFTFAVAGNTSNKKLAITDTTASTSYTTGSVTVAGGVGIAGALSVNNVFRGVFPSASAVSSSIAKNMSVASNGTVVQGIILDRTKTFDTVTGSMNKICFYTRFGITLREVKAVLAGSSPSVTYQIYYGNDRTSGTAIFSTSKTSTSTTTGDLYNSFSSATIPTDNWVWIETTAASGTIDDFALSFYYSQD